MTDIDFTKVGGLEDHIQYIREMLIYPFIYQEIYKGFHLKPPRGILFYGPPGTGKTLIAKALCNECSKHDRKVTFFSRKGADCLSKWVGSSEKNLKSLFDQAHQKRPSIIFFDELDGLAPKRSEQQDQIHSSVVCTLLALMDGLNTQKDVIVIGSTNRIESVDPALRRPGRFDRELYFPLPAFNARKDIIHLYVDQWDERSRPSNELIDELAANTVGFSGADIQSLCWEAVMCGIRKKYPHINAAENRIRNNLKSFTVEKSDFLAAQSKIALLRDRKKCSPRKKIPIIIYPLLEDMLQRVMDKIVANYSLLFLNPDKEYWNSFDIFNNPRLLLTGSSLQGQSTYLAPAILHKLEHLPVYTMDVSTLYKNRTTEEACIQKMNEVHQNLPAILYTPDISSWFDIVDETTRIVFLNEINKIKKRIFLLSTVHVSYTSLSPTLQEFFSQCQYEVVEMKNPERNDRLKFFRHLFSIKCVIPPPPQPRRPSFANIDSQPSTSGDRGVKRIREPNAAWCSTVRTSRRIQGLSAISLPDLPIINYGASTSQSCLGNDNTEQPSKKIKFVPRKEFEDAKIKQEVESSGDEIVPEDEKVAMACYMTGVNLSGRDKVVIDRTKLSDLLAQVLEFTEDCSVHTLETLYGKFNARISCYQEQWDRSQLPKDLENIIRNFKRE